MIKKLLLSLVSVIISTVSQAQIPEDFLRVDVSDSDGAKITQERSFTKESLFGYMNGGAELYLEYGFDRLVVSDLDINDKDLKVEVYRMPSADMAFGIYSVNIFRCDAADPLTEYYCQSDYQVQFHKGKYYVNIINNDGSQGGLEAARLIAGQLIALIDMEPFNKADYIPCDQEYPGIEKMMLVAGELALANYAFEYAAYIEGLSEYRMLIVSYEGGIMLVIRSEGKEDRVIHIDAG